MDKEPTVRVNLMIPRSLHEQMDRISQETFRNRSKLYSMAITEWLELYRERDSVKKIDT